MAAKRNAIRNGVGNDYHVPNLDRALTILELLGQNPDGLGVTEMTQLTGFPKNSVFRICMTLYERGYLERNEKTKQFNMTRRLLDLGSTTIGEASLVERAWDDMVELRNRVEETVLIGVLSGDRGVVLERVHGLHAFNYNVVVGASFVLHTAAPGKALLAFLPDRERDMMLSRLKYPRFTARTITNRKAFERELGKVRKTMCAYDMAEELDGCYCIAAPVFNSRSYPVASIWTTGPSNRLPQSDFGRLSKIVVTHANAITEKLGGKVPTTTTD